MQQFIVYNDIHKYSDYEMPLKVEHGAIYNGDIFELRSCKRSDVDMITREMKEFEKEVQGRYNYGNHEMDPHRLYDRIVVDNVVFTHAEYEFWGEKKSLKFMKKRKGKGAFGRLLSAQLDKYRGLKPFYLSKKQKNRCMDTCVETGTDTFVGAHKHPSRVEVVL